MAVLAAVARRRRALDAAAAAAAAGKKVVIVVGPVGSQTADYIDERASSSPPRPVPTAPPSTRSTARTRRGRGSGASPRARTSSSTSVTATASRARTARSSTTSKDGLGLNATRRQLEPTYYGEYYVDPYLNFAPNSVVILNRLCYASGNSEWGSGYPTKATAIKRVDNFGAGFLRTGARAVFAEGVDNVGLHPVGPVQVEQTLKQIFCSDPARGHALGLQLPRRADAGQARPARSDGPRTTTTGR